MITIKHNGRTITLSLPQNGDIEINLDLICSKPYQPTQTQNNLKITNDSVRKSLSNSGPSGRKLYKWITENSDLDSIIDIDPIFIESKMGLVPIALGRVLGSLERGNLISVLHRKRDDCSRICSYKIKVNEHIEIDNEPQENIYIQTIQDIEQMINKRAGILFRAICKNASVDGTWVGSHLKELTSKMRPIPNRFPVTIATPTIK